MGLLISAGRKRTFGDCEELTFFEAEQWTPETERPFMVKIEELLIVAGHPINRAG
ncbi:MAG TPA: hypothetical protein VK658_21515 [Chryseolinea sp.]|nr:hypothetical protein [Chryseolinea sp.]